MYYWTHTQQSSPNVNQDVNKLQPMWPPTQEQTEDNRPGLKYTEAGNFSAPHPLFFSVQCNYSE